MALSCRNASRAKSEYGVNKLSVSVPKLDERLRQPLLQLGVALAFWAAALIGDLFVLPRANVALVWPAAGLALAVAFRLGPKYLLGIGLGAVSVHFTKTGDLVPALAATAGTLMGAWLGMVVLRLAGVRLGLRRLRDVLCLFTAVVLAGTITSAMGASVVFLAGMTEWRGWGSLWWICWVADTVGALLLAPVLLTPMSGVMSRPAFWERLGLAVAVALVSWLVYADVALEGTMARPLSYAVFPLLIWAGVRCGVREVAQLLLLHAAIALLFTAAGRGPFATGMLSESLLSLHTHLAMLAFSMLVLAAAMAERRQAEGALREREAQYRLLVENQSDLVMKLDREGRIVFASPSLCRLLQLPPQRLLDQPARKLLQEHGARAAAGAWNQVLKPPYEFHLEETIDTAEGRRWIAWVAKGVLEHGRVCAVVAVGRDVTARRQAEQRAHQHLQELAHVGRLGAMGELASGLAHELNQPLCAITSYSQASLRLLGADADPELRNAMERIAANAQRAGGIIKQMRAFVRKDEQLQQPENINHLVEEVISLTRTDARHHGVQLDLQLAPGLPAVDVAAIQIQQVLVNLVRNAVEAMEEARSTRRLLSISTRRGADGMVEVCVADTGPGLPAGLVDQVFHPFVTTKVGGMGLGLSISRSIIEAHGGKLLARERSGSGGGSEFRFSLPPSRTQQAEAG